MTQTQNPLEIFGSTLIKIVNAPETRLEAALDACNGTIRFAEDYPAFEACYPKRHGSSVIFIHEVYRKFVPQGEIGFLYTTVEGNMKMGNLEDLKTLNCYVPLIDYSVRVALNLDHMSLNSVHKPTITQVINDALAKYVSDKVALLQYISRYATEQEIVNCVDCKEFEQMVMECREMLCSEEASDGKD